MFFFMDLHLATFGNMLSSRVVRTDGLTVPSTDPSGLNFSAKALKVKLTHAEFPGQCGI